MLSEDAYYAVPQPSVGPFSHDEQQASSRHFSPLIACEPIFQLLCDVRADR